jgi:hypothetical protein
MRSGLVRWLTVLLPLVFAACGSSNSDKWTCIVTCPDDSVHNSTQTAAQAELACSQAETAGGCSGGSGSLSCTCSSH